MRGQTSSISIRTNLQVGARFQIGDPGGVFLVDTGSEGTDLKSTAVILSAKLPARKK